MAPEEQPMAPGIGADLARHEMTQPFVVIDDGQVREVDATVSDGRVLLATEQVCDALGWELKPEGLCQGGVCIPVRDRDALVAADGVNLVELGSLPGHDPSLGANGGGRALS